MSVGLDSHPHSQNINKSVFPTANDEQLEQSAVLI